MIRDRIPEWAAGSAVHEQAQLANYGYLSTYQIPLLRTYGLGWGYSPYPKDRAAYGVRLGEAGVSSHGYGSENDASRPTAYGEIDGPQRQPHGDGLGMMLGTTGGTRNGNGYASDHDIGKLGVWFTNYVNAKTWGVPECEIDLEYVADPTLSTYGRP